MQARPSFSNDFPRTPEVDALVDDFVRGDYARIRTEAPRLDRSTKDPEVQRATRTLLERTKPDPLAIGLLTLAAILLTVLATFWIANGKAPPAEAPTTTMP